MRVCHGSVGIKVVRLKYKPVGFVVTMTLTVFIRIRCHCFTYSAERQTSNSSLLSSLSHCSCHCLLRNCQIVQKQLQWRRWGTWPETNSNPKRFVTSRTAAGCSGSHTVRSAGKIRAGDKPPGNETAESYRYHCHSCVRPSVRPIDRPTDDEANGNLINYD